MGQSTEFPILYKRTAGDEVQQWAIRVDERADGLADITVRYGRVGGKQVEQVETISKGKNAGKKNATTPWTQAVAEAKAKHTNQIERSHYGTDESASESAGKRAAAPMLAQKYMDWDKAANDGKGGWKYTTHAKKVDWKNAYAQPKLNGHRGIFRDGRMFSREGVDITAGVPHIVEAIGRVFGHSLGGHPLVLDGELYTHGVAVTKIGGWISGRKEEARRLSYNLYDAMLPLPFGLRNEALLGCLRHFKPCDLAPLVEVVTTPVRNEAELYRWRRSWLQNGYEGAMLRHGDAPYEAGKRSASLLKCKVWEDEEFLVVGCHEGAGTNAGCAVFECVTAAGAEFDCLAPGSIPQKRKYLETKEQWIGRKLTIRFSEWTQVEGKLPKPFHVTALQFHEPL